MRHSTFPPNVTPAGMPRREGRTRTDGPKSPEAALPAADG